MVDINKPLSPHFKLGELLRSDTAERRADWREAQYSPDATVQANLAWLVTTALEPIRTTFGYPIHISSGYRCPEVNEAVGSKPSSQHLLGQAADCQVDEGFLTAPEMEPLRSRIRQRIEERTGAPARADLSANFYLFAYVALRMKDFDVDQLIHEYGSGPGRPAWVHIAASPGEASKGQILGLGDKLAKSGSLSLEEALGLGT
ncbi:MAG: D-Ala-D-Ala carboxypeptidase family metallohydrolase [Rhodocyclaceae bacterium]|nr:D-Ala-D-Ala carboxypeptidase family metallohydrolase [Rhodocyclaceae bacterium]